MSRRIPIHIKIIISLLLGAGVGVALNLLWTEGTWSGLGVGDKSAFLAGRESAANEGAGLGAAATKFLIDANRFIGQLFIRCLRFVAVPIVLFSLIAGAASLGDVRKLGRIGGKTLAWFTTTTVIAIIAGMTLAHTIRPGTLVGEASREKLTTQYKEEAAKNSAEGQKRAATLSAWDQILNTVPVNPFGALATAEMMQVVVFALALGGALTLVPREKAAWVIGACQALTEAVTHLVQWFMRLAPVAVFALICPIVATTGLDVMGALGAYALTVVGGLALVNFGVYPAILRLFTPSENKVTFRRFFRAMAPAQLLAFSSSSSNATLAVNMQCARRVGAPAEIVSFVLPLGATINMNGTALYQAVIAVFLSQLYGIDLSLHDQLMIVLTATLVAIGSAGIPGASVVLMVVVLQAAHVPPEGIAVVLGMDRILDMCRTVVNTGGDAMTAVVVASSEGRLLTEEEAARAEE